MTDNGSERNRPYVVLEQRDLGDVVRESLASAGVEISTEQTQLLEQLGGDVYVEKSRIPSRNAAHALTQIGRSYPLGSTPPLVAVSERMFKPRRVNIDAGDPRISLL